MEPKIKLEFTLNETNVILNALGRMPYEAVFTIVESLRLQAAKQLEPSDGLKNKDLPN